MDRLSKLLSEEKNQLNAIEDELLTLAKQLETMKQQSNSQKRNLKQSPLPFKPPNHLFKPKKKKLP